jgi:uncharacterized membrane protein YhaH (DUF805 family)
LYYFFAGMDVINHSLKSGWMFLVALIPLVGGILLLVWCISDGEAFDNAYGAVPTNTL